MSKQKTMSATEQLKKINAVKKEIFALDYMELDAKSLVDSKSKKEGTLIALLSDPKGRTIALSQIDKIFKVECIRRGFKFFVNDETNAKKLLAQLVCSSQNHFAPSFAITEKA